MKIKATLEQLQQIAVNAILASRPVGMGQLHYNPTQKFSPTDIKTVSNHDGKLIIVLDYVGGRMVKLTARQDEPGIWSFSNRAATADYQSWVAKYPTYADLARSVPGVEVLDAV